METLDGSADEGAVSFCLAVTSTFTAEPIADVLEFWLSELSYPARVTFAPYGQVFPSLLEPTGTLAHNANGANVVLVDPSGWLRGAGLDEAATLGDELCSAVKSCAHRTGLHHVLMMCPVTPEFLSDQDRVRALRTFEHVVMDGSAAESKLDTILPRDIEALYPVDGSHDSYAERVGDIPYTAEQFAAMATVVVRRLSARLTPRPKVVVADCDGVLWDGVVGEDGPKGITVGENRRAVRQFLADQVTAGRLLCLCSRNDEADVNEAFTARPELPLRRDQITATRINWEPKSRNLRSLAAELDLGSDSFVFLDDDPVQCAEVRSAYPEVLTLQLPADPEAARRFLEHCWPLDTTLVTAEDRERSRYYRQEISRRQAGRHLTHADFVASLKLAVTIAPMTPELADRVDQLAKRTNQFNFTGARLDGVPPSETGGGTTLTVAASDRFGDYGVVGTMRTRESQGVLWVDSFLLSCRALGRGIEHRMVAWLGELATARGLSRVGLAHRETDRNAPAGSFLSTLPAERTDADGFVWYLLPSGAAAEVKYRAADHPAPAASPVDNGSRGADGAAPVASWELTSRIATELTTAGEILTASRDRRDRRRDRRGPAASPTEETIMRLWGEVLGTEPTTVADDFFQLGGDSVALVRFMVRARSIFGVELPTDVLFSSAFSVTNMARAVIAQQIAEAPDDALPHLLQGLSDDEITAVAGGGDR